MYAGLKHSHMLFIAISIILFNYRFLLKKLNKPTAKILKVLPHVNDTLLLLTGTTMAFIASINPMDQSWLMAKIIALFIYIGFGMMALKSQGLKSNISYVLAITTFIFIAITAIKKAPFLFNI